MVLLNLSLDLVEVQSNESDEDIEESENEETDER